MISGEGMQRICDVRLAALEGIFWKRAIGRRARSRSIWTNGVRNGTELQQRTVVACNRTCHRIRMAKVRMRVLDVGDQFVTAKSVGSLG